MNPTHVALGRSAHLLPCLVVQNGVPRLQSEEPVECGARAADQSHGRAGVVDGRGIEVVGTVQAAADGSGNVIDPLLISLGSGVIPLGQDGRQGGLMLVS